MTATPDRIGILALVPDNWHGIWMPRHQVLHRLARYFEVVWVEPARSWRDYWGGRFRPEKKIQYFVSQSPQFTVYDPGRWLPQIHRPKMLLHWLRKRRVQRACRLLKRKGCNRIVLYVWRPEFSWALDAIDADLTCYHIDDEYGFSMTEQPNTPEEVALIRAANLVIVHSHRLQEKKGGLNPETILIPNGVDYDAYSTPAPMPADLASIPQPLLGYVGVVKIQLDFDLLFELATRHREWSIVLVGPIGYLGEKATALQRLTALPNVYLLGNRQIHELPAYMQHMNACLMCYEVNDYTHYIYPLKLHEYLATGRPVVAAPIDSILPFWDVVCIAHTVDEWDAKLQEALENQQNTAAAKTARQARAAQHDWNVLVGKIAAHLSSRVEARREST